LVPDNRRGATVSGQGSSLFTSSARSSLHARKMTKQHHKWVSNMDVVREGQLKGLPIQLGVVRLSEQQLTQHISDCLFETWRKHRCRSSGGDGEPSQLACSLVWHCRVSLITFHATHVLQLPTWKCLCSGNTLEARAWDVECFPTTYAVPTVWVHMPVLRLMKRLGAVSGLSCTGEVTQSEMLFCTHGWWHMHCTRIHNTSSSTRAALPRPVLLTVSMVCSVPGSAGGAA
jgi:hypothetical protein